MIIIISLYIACDDHPKKNYSWIFRFNPKKWFKKKKHEEHDDSTGDCSSLSSQRGSPVPDV